MSVTASKWQWSKRRQAMQKRINHDENKFRNKVQTVRQETGQAGLKGMRLHKDSHTERNK